MTEPTFALEFERTKRKVTDGKGGAVLSWDLDTDFLTPTDGWSVSFRSEDPKELDGLELEPVRIVVNGRTQMIGRVDISHRGGDGPRTISLQGRDYLADLTTCCVDPRLVVKPNMKLSQLVKQAAGPVGISDVVGPWSRNQLATGAAGKSGTIKDPATNAKRPEDRETIFEFLNKQAARSGLTIQPGLSRSEVVLQAPTYDGNPIGTIRRKTGEDSGGGNNALTAECSRDYSDVPTFALMAGLTGSPIEGRGKTRGDWSLATEAQGIASEVAALLNRVFSGRAPATGTNALAGKLYRLLYWKEQGSNTQAQLDAALKRVIAERTRKTLTYTVTLRGTTDIGTGNTWAPDSLVDVDDDVANVHERLWIAKRKFTGNAQGVTTQLELWRPNSYIIDPGT